MARKLKIGWRFWYPSTSFCTYVALLALQGLACVIGRGAQAAVTTIALTADTVPGGNGQFSTFTIPELNATGQVAFRANLQNTSGGTLDDTGLYLHNGTSLVGLARENAGVPEGNGQFSYLDPPSLNSAGQIVFYASLRNTGGGANDDSGIYLHNGSTLDNVVHENSNAPEGNGQFASIGLPPALNNAGQVAFTSSLRGTSGGTNDDLGVYFHNGTALSNIVREGATPPDGNGQFESFGAPELNGTYMAFFAGLRNTSGGMNDNNGLYLYNGSTLAVRVRENASPPEGNGQFQGFGAPASLNASGQIAFWASLRNTSGGTNDNNGIYLHDGSMLVNVARENANVPEGNGQFELLDTPRLNAAGHVVFHSSLRNTSGGANDNSGLYLHNGIMLVNLVRENASPPDGNGQFASFSSPELNDAGQIAFIANMRNTSGGLSDNVGIYLTDGTETVKAARETDTLAGATVTEIAGQNLNDLGQVTFRATFATGQGIFLFTPDLYWRAATSGQWDTAANWTLSLRPGAPHNVSIDAATSLVVTGPAADATVRSLTVGNDDGDGAPTLNLQAGATLTATSGVVLNDNATVGFEIGGSGLANLARMVSDGSVTLDGMLAVSLIDGFMPSAGDMFDIFDWSSLSGQFDDLDLPDLADDLMWNASQLYATGTLRVLLAGDYNADGAVDAADYVVWRKSDGTQQGYDTWRAHFGQMAGSASGTEPASHAAVPEPAGLPLLLTAALAMFWFLRRR